MYCRTPSIRELAVDRRGHVRFFRPDRGFGFIMLDDGGPDIYLHIKGFAKKTVERRPLAVNTGFWELFS